MLQPTFTVKTEKEDTNYARLVIEPLEKGYGHTLGVGLRRVMLSSIPGSAVTSVRVNGVQHQFTTLEGMKEDVVEFVLNVKQLNFSMTGDKEEVVVKLSAKGKGEVTGKDLSLPANVTLANPEQILAVLADSKSKLDAELTISSGIGYSVSDEREMPALGEIPVDAAFSPIIKVAYKIEATRVGRRTDFDKLIMDVWTNGTIEPEEALNQAADILVKHYNQILDPVIVETEPEISLEDKIEDEVYRLTVEELDLPTRIANALRKGGYKTVKDLTTADKAEIAKVKNLGEKSVSTVAKALEQKGVTFTDDQQAEDDESEE